MHNRLSTRRLTIVTPRIALALTLVLFARGAAAQAQQFYSVTPCRAVDTRIGYGGIIYSAVQRNFTIKTTCSVPTDAKSVTLNITVIGPTLDGHVIVWPSNLGVPSTSNINFVANTPALANGVIVGLAPNPPDLAVVYGVAGGSGTLHLVIDVTGYFK